MRAAVIEDQKLVREYLTALLRRRFRASPVVAIGSMAELTARAAELAEVELVVFDIDLGDGSTLEWAVRRSETGGAGTMVALSSITGAFPFQRLQRAGISIAHKSDGEAELVQVIRQALTGVVVLSRGAMAVLRPAGRDPVFATKILGDTELRVLALLGQRLSTEEIAEMLGCALGTATDHRKRIMSKLGLHNIEEVIDYAIRHGIVHDTEASAAARTRRRA
ncbi:MAG: response regulator transcription factor [Verrucomicrobia bacterium]|nr:response regulator transcription factor [Verrucomicrobiota bacterium]